MRIFVINPGSTSTKLALFNNEELIIKTSVFHKAEDLLRYPDINCQLPYRLEVIEQFLKENNIDLNGIDAIIGRGGGMLPVPSGAMYIDESLLDDVVKNVANTSHPSSLGIQLAYELNKKYGGMMLTGDPICVDELIDEARITGIKGIYRKSHTHALNAKGTARIQAKKLGKNYEDCNFIVAHIDGGITVTCHRQGKMIDATDGTGGEGSFTPSRCGAVPAIELLNYIEGKDLKEVRKLFSNAGGMVSLLHTNDANVIHKKVEDGDEETTLIWKAMIYNIIKAIGSFATVLEGNVDNIILTGGLVRFKDITDKISESCQFIAPIVIYPDEVEMEALASLAFEVLNHKLIPHRYNEVIKRDR